MEAIFPQIGWISTVNIYISIEQLEIDFTLHYRLAEGQFFSRESIPRDSCPAIFNQRLIKTALSPFSFDVN